VNEHLKSRLKSNLSEFHDRVVLTLESHPTASSQEIVRLAAVDYSSSQPNDFARILWYGLQGSLNLEELLGLFQMDDPDFYGSSRMRWSGQLLNFNELSTLLGNWSFLDLFENLKLGEDDDNDIDSPYHQLLKRLTERDIELGIIEPDDEDDLDSVDS